MIVEPAAGLGNDTVDALAAGIRGRVLLPGDAEYDEARVVRNGLIDRRPALIIQCHGTADVVDSVNLARDHHLLLSVRGGGHNIAGNAVNDGGMVIDLSRMRSVAVDPDLKIARVQGGATWGDVDRETQLWGLAVPGGQVSTTGVGGLSLHGGMGVLHRTYGLTIDSLVSVEIVTADGQVRTASATENPDLFWAVRGAGSNFGVVTWFEFALHPVGPEIYQVVPLFSLDDAPAVLRKYRSFGASAPDAINPQAIFWSVPPIEDFPKELHGTPILVVQVMYAGDPEEGERLLRPVLDWATPIVDLGGRAPYALTQSSFDPFFPVGGLYYWKSLLLSEATDEALDAIVDAARDRPSPRAMINLWQLGGAIGRIAPDATAYVHRQAPYLLSFDTSWVDPADTDRCIAWTRRIWSTMHDRFGLGGAYLNFAGFGEEKDALVRASYGGNFERLVGIKGKYDPANMFRMNNNIQPPGL
ncbi:MAG: FAD-binding oxidoreductase [Chloroflexi bacterium]|nr:FAD-binding oxidoreductase [Chloroflexota bacterium]